MRSFPEGHHLFLGAHNTPATVGRGMGIANSQRLVRFCRARTIKENGERPPLQCTPRSFFHARLSFLSFLFFGFFFFTFCFWGAAQDIICRSYVERGISREGEKGFWREGPLGNSVERVASLWERPLEERPMWTGISVCGRDLCVKLWRESSLWRGHSVDRVFCRA